MNPKQREELSAGISECRHAIPALARKLAKVYQLLDWTWVDSCTGPHIPSSEEISARLGSCLDDLCNPELRHDDLDDISSRVGGLFARYMVYEDGFVSVEIGMEIGPTIKDDLTYE